MFTKAFRVFFVSLAILAGSLSAFSFDRSGILDMHYGPNLSLTAMGNSPIIWGEWLPQLITAVDFSWIEPLGDSLPYGEGVNVNAAFLRMQAGLELSPFYENFSFGMGLRPFSINPQIGLNFVYSNLVYFDSNIEMAMAGSSSAKQKGSIAQNWNTKYIFDNIYGDEDIDFDFSQSFTMGANLDYRSKTGLMVGVYFNFILVDITTGFDGKSYDYQRNMPVFSRDYLLELCLFGRYPLSQTLIFLYEIDFYKSGVSKSGNTIHKESLHYGKVLSGLEYAWGNRNKHRFTLTPGFFMRGKSRFYDGNVGQQFIIQLQYSCQFGLFSYF